MENKNKLNNTNNNRKAGGIMPKKTFMEKFKQYIDGFTFTKALSLAITVCLVINIASLPAYAAADNSMSRAEARRIRNEHRRQGVLWTD
ncbi:MAG: hypothetical protein FWC85_05160, partial [Elusimicrobia bacterium]|nr:hypothetical protein [Elusimicrobiota bacterium]